MLYIFSVNDHTGDMRDTGLSVSIDIDIVELIDLLNYYAKPGHHYRYHTANTLRDRGLPYEPSQSTPLSNGYPYRGNVLPHSGNLHTR